MQLILEFSPDKRADQNTGSEKAEPGKPDELKAYRDGQREGIRFLRRKFADLHDSPEAVSAARRTEAKNGEKVSQKPEARIASYIHRFREILDRKEPAERERGIRALKEIMHRLHVIKPSEVPESYFGKQKELARRLGHGDIVLTKEMRQGLIENIVADQTSTLDSWLNYLTTHDAEAYPDWARYWAFRSMLGLSAYDKEKKRFAKRTKDTVAPFPDLNREALAYVVDIIAKKAKGLDVEAARDNPELSMLIRGESFAKLYAYAIEKVTPADVGELKKAAGEWKTYKQGSDHMPLVKSLQGHGTGWCTAGESTAQAQLTNGDFHVYYSYDKNGKSTVPRIAIRMEGDSIGEVRGVAAEQNLDPYVAEIAKKKLAEFPDGPRYEKKAEDMRRLTAVEKKHRQNEKLAPDELRFLYGLDGKIEGFGYGNDPRIGEIKSGRNIKEDALIINIISVLEERFLNQPKHYTRPEGADIAKVRSTLEANPAAMLSLSIMELTGGAPDIVAETDDAFIFGDCSAESPSGRRNLNFNQAAKMASEFGAELMDEVQYRRLQELGAFDTASWSWLKTPEDVLKSGRALNGRRLGDVVDVRRGGARYHGGNAGFRCALRVQKS